MKKLKALLWFSGLMTLCGSASADPVTIGAALSTAASWAAANIPTILSAVGAVASLAGSRSQGQAQEQAAIQTGQAQNAQAQVAAASEDAKAAQYDEQAEQYDELAGQQRAAGQRRAQEQRRQAAIASSNVLARTGGGSLDPSILGLTGNIAGEGEYNALTNMYEAEETARGSESSGGVSRAQAGNSRSQAQLYRMQGDAALQRGATTGAAVNTAAKFNAASTIFSAGATLFSKYGGGGVKSYDPVDSYRFSTRGSGD